MADAPAVKLRQPNQPAASSICANSRSAESRIALAMMEYKLLEYFLKQPGRALARNAILMAVWGLFVFVTARSVDRCVTTLRTRIEVEAHRPATSSRFVMSGVGSNRRMVTMHRCRSSRCAASAVSNCRAVHDRINYSGTITTANPAQRKYRGRTLRRPDRTRAAMTNCLRPRPTGEKAMLRLARCW